MLLEEFRARMEAWWLEHHSAAIARKDSMKVTMQLLAMYEVLEAEDRGLADVVLAEWVHSVEGQKRFDAVAVIRKHAIRSAAPQVRQQLSVLASATGPEARAERVELQGLLRRLEHST